MPYITELTLDSKKIQEPTPHLCYAIHTATSLKKITIKVENSHINNWKSTWFIEAIAASRTLTAFGLIDSALTPDKFAELMTIARDIISRNKRITSLSIETMNLEDEKVKSVDQMLTSATWLKHLALEAPLFDHTLYATIKRATHLESLVINTQNYPDPQPAHEAAAALSHLSKLTLKGGDMRYLLQRLSLNSLKELRIKPEFGTVGVQELAQMIKKNRTLRAFTLNRQLKHLKKFKGLFIHHNRFQHCKS